ncbi:lipid droplet assembly factor 1 isoform X1 [Antechinus flavipes]|uniref:lipid droplet assembly factor 1 isoform X1 n=1 Tax=Antechinus flavipes TaxID=38775 RepID=UPI002236B21D|nr:lipid droplet assembly factor 1 isoform X1 [Antechinus flavipes]
MKILLFFAFLKWIERSPAGMRQKGTAPCIKTKRKPPACILCLHPLLSLWTVPVLHPPVLAVSKHRRLLAFSVTTLRSDPSCPLLLQTDSRLGSGGVPFVWLREIRERRGGAGCRRRIGRRRDRREAEADCHQAPAPYVHLLWLGLLHFLYGLLPPPARGRGPSLLCSADLRGWAAGSGTAGAAEEV